MIIKKRTLLILSAILLPMLFTLSGCKNEKKPVVYKEPESSITKAVAVLEPVNGSNVHGIVRFNLAQNGIHIIADVVGLSAGKHGFHIHEYGDISSDDGTSAGGHFNPEGTPHAGPDNPNRHVGDMGNIISMGGGTAHYEWTDSLMSFTGTHSIIGRAVVVHQGEDDLTSQPSGNSGKRVAVGVIGIAKE